MSEPVTVTVLLRPAHGGDVPPEELQAKTIARHAPDPAAAEAVRRWFAEHGFEAAPAVGPALAVTAPRETVEAVLPGLAEKGELGADALPAEITPHVRAVAVQPPLDFGPTSY